MKARLFFLIAIFASLLQVANAEQYDTLWTSSKFGGEDLRNAFFSKNDSLVIVSTYVNGIYELDAKTGRELKHIPGIPYIIKMSMDGNTLLTTTGRIFDAATYLEKAILQQNLPENIGCDFDSTAAVVVITVPGITYSIFDGKTGKKIDTLGSSDKNRRGTSAPVVSPNGKYLAFLGFNSYKDFSTLEQLFLYNLETKELIKVLKQWYNPKNFLLGKMSFSPDSKNLILSVLNDGTNNHFVYFWDVTTFVETIKYVKACINLFDISKDGKYLVGQGCLGSASLFNYQTDKLLHKYPDWTSELFVKFSNNSKYFVTGGIKLTLNNNTDFTEIIEPKNEIAIPIFPNPTNTFVNINIENSTNSQIKITNITGETICLNCDNRIFRLADSIQLNISDLIPGVYIITVYNQNIQVNYKLIKDK